MWKQKKLYVIIGAAGSGKRMAAPMPKQFLTLGNKTILEQTVGAFRREPAVDRILVVTAQPYVQLCTDLFRQDIASGRLAVVTGGRERQDSIGAAIARISQEGAEEDSLVLIHDGVRPYVSGELIRSVADGADRYGAVIPAVPPRDTIRHMDEGTLERAKLCCVQTPQGFSFGVIAKAFAQAKADGFYGTDDAGLVERIGHQVTIIDGESTNIKITLPEDLPVEQRIGTGFDVHRLTEGRKLILGGVEIPYERGLLGHSDADVLVHALMDALLGAAAMGDIGKLFPDSDARYRGISSMELLRQVADRLRQAGYTLSNADMTVICQKPRLAAYIPAMRENIARVMETDVDRISVKATTTEKLGFTGREEGIAAEAVCLLCR